MAQRVAAIFHNRNAAERAADALVDLGADRGQISLLARGEDGKLTSSPTESRTDAARAAATTPSTGRSETAGAVEPAREVGDAGAPLTTTDTGDAAKGAAIGAAAGLAAGLLALTVPGIGLVLAAGPLALAMAGGAVAGGVYGSLHDIGIEEKHARAYEERIRSGDVLLTAVLPTTMSEDRVLDVLSRHGAEDVSFAEDRQPSRMPSSASAVGTARTADRTVQAGTGEVRVPLTEERAEVRKEEREAGQVSVTKQTDEVTKHISEPVTETRVVAERRAVPPGEQYQVDPNATTLREGETLRVPVVQEELKVEKVPRVTEEVVLRTEKETKQVEQDVQLRRERVEVEEEGEAEVKNLDTAARRNL